MVRALRNRLHIAWLRNQGPVARRTRHRPGQAAQRRDSAGLGAAIVERGLGCLSQRLQRAGSPASPPVWVVTAYQVREASPTFNTTTGLLAAGAAVMVVRTRVAPGRDLG